MTDLRFRGALAPLRRPTEALPRRVDAPIARLRPEEPAHCLRPATIARAVTAEGRLPFAFFGPTCDSADQMKGPFLLPADVAEGDWIELGQLGA